ncbi:zf-HC2 domain-containing protein [Cupriavidus sp. DL-D2]|uniref:anti-sigma factor family protein n=1 Tax=Cupriavidus sp. DL-D2 TaxID=3144974 RepID=UPI003215B62B
MDCIEARHLLQATADGEAGAADSVRLERHLEDCDSCVDTLRRLQSLRHAVQHAASYYRAPAGLREHILESLPSSPSLSEPGWDSASHPPAEPGWRRWFR